MSFGIFRTSGNARPAPPVRSSLVSATQPMAKAAPMKATRKISVGDKVWSRETGSWGTVVEFGKWGKFDTRVKKADGKVFRCEIKNLDLR